MGRILEKIPLLKIGSKRDKGSKKTLTSDRSIVLRVYGANNANSES